MPHPIAFADVNIAILNGTTHQAGDVLTIVPGNDAMQWRPPPTSKDGVVSVTTDGSIAALPAKSVIVGIKVVETGGVDNLTFAIGTTPGGTDLLESATVNAGQITGIAALSLTQYAFDAGTTLYVSSTAWAAAAIDVTTLSF